MFWGATVSTNKSYREIVKMPFHVSMASLALQSEKESGKDKKYISLMLRYDGKEFVLCTLEYGRVMCAPLDLVFDKGEQVEFFIMGHGNIHLSGFVIPDSDENTYCDYTVDSECSESSSTEEYSTSESEEIESSADLTSDDSPKLRRKKNRDITKCRKPDLKKDCLKEKAREIDKIMKSKIPAKKGKIYSSSSELDSNESEIKHEEKMESSKKKCVNEKRKSSSEVNLNNISEKAVNVENLTSKKKSLSVSAEKERAKSDNDIVEENGLSIKSGSEIKSLKPTQSMKNAKRKSVAATKQLSSTPTIKKNRKSIGNLSNKQSQEKETGLKMQSGIEIKDIKVGNGPAARKGKLVHLCYVGYLDNGEEFSSVRNRPFSFRLGNNDDDVVKGLSSGIEGMKVGGKRIIVIPPSEGFGNKTVGSVPPNSTLTYEVELKAVS